MSYGVRTVGRRRDADQERTPGKVRGNGAGTFPL